MKTSFWLRLKVGIHMIGAHEVTRPSMNGQRAVAYSALQARALNVTRGNEAAN